MPTMEIEKKILTHAQKSVQGALSTLDQISSNNNSFIKDVDPMTAKDFGTCFTGVTIKS